MRRAVELYSVQAPSWPETGRQLLAAYDESTVTVYQAYRPAIADHAVSHQRFGGEFSLSRMSWIKPGFLWMMYRAGWATKEGQERVLAVHLKRAAFDEILSLAVESSFAHGREESRDEWQRRLRSSEVRLQWDPDHDPYGARQERRAIQLGLRGATLEKYAGEWIDEIEDLTPFVREQHSRLVQGGVAALSTPLERVYPVTDRALCARLGV